MPCAHGSFCNFDYGETGSCEACSDCPDCYSCGLPDQGANDCSNACSDSATVFCSKKQRSTQCEIEDQPGPPRRKTQLLNPLRVTTNTYVGKSHWLGKSHWHGDIKALYISESYLPDRVVQRIGHNLWANNSNGAKTVPSVCPNLARSCGARALASSLTDCPRGYRREAGDVGGWGTIDGRGGGQRVSMPLFSQDACSFRGIVLCLLRHRAGVCRKVVCLAVSFLLLKCCFEPPCL